MDFGYHKTCGYFKIQFTPMVNTDGNTDGVMVFLFDLTESEGARREAERARELAEQSSKAKTTFLAKMSHEIRTPMNAIVGMSELLLHESLSGHQMSFIKDIYSSAHSLLSIINDILDMSKIESGKLTQNPIDYDFQALMDSIASMFRHVAHKKGLEFLYESEGDVPEFVYGDDIRLKQVLTNICGNAVKFTDSGYVRLKVFSMDDSIVFEVKDTGQGIHSEEIPTIFNAFEQSKTQRNRETEGTGLGLTICKAFVEMMGGSITFDSELDKGTTVTVRIPKVLGNGAAVRQEMKVKKKQVVCVRDTRILVVDDNGFNLKVACGLLKLFNIDAETASSGMEAVKKVSESEFDIVFMDYMMPEMDGIETAGKIRGLGLKYGDLPIIALTANAIQGAREMLLASGLNGFITKPIDIEELKEILIKWLPPDKISVDAVGEAQANESESGKAQCGGFLDNLRNIRQINVEIGLNRVSGIESIYYDTVEDFCKKLADECNKMSGFLSSNDLKNFSILIHAMKSMLSTIGAMQLSEWALRLETASKDNDVDYCAEHFPALYKELFILREQLSAIFDEGEPDSVKEPGDGAFLNESVQNAKSAADEYDSDAGIKAINSLLSFDFGIEINLLLESALNAFKDYDCERAGETLSGILK